MVRGRSLGGSLAVMLLYQLSSRSVADSTIFNHRTSAKKAPSIEFNKDAEGLLSYVLILYVKFRPRFASKEVAAALTLTRQTKVHSCGYTLVQRLSYHYAQESAESTLAEFPASFTMSLPETPAAVGSPDLVDSDTLQKPSETRTKDTHLHLPQPTRLQRHLLLLAIHLVAKFRRHTGSVLMLTKD